MAIGIWLAAVVGFLLFLTFGDVTVYLADETRDSASVLAVWSDHVDNLPEVGAGVWWRVVFFGAALLFVAGSAIGLWYALAAGISPAKRTREGVPAEAEVGE